MKYLLTRMVSFSLTFGIFFAVSCTYFESSQNETSISYQERIDQRIVEINQLLLDDPDQTDLIIEKGELLLALAELMADPYERYPVYSELYRISKTTSEVQALVVNAWSDEQESGVRLLQSGRNDDSVDHSNAIIGHFQNAITLQPDSLVTYSLLATTYYESGSIQHAIEILESAIELSGLKDRTFKEKLAYLYLEAGRTDVSVRFYENLIADYPADNHLIHGLINAYMLSNETDKAIAILRELIAEYPTRYNYQEALATQLYYQLKEKSEDFVQADGESEISVNDLIERIHEIDALFSSLTNTIPINEDYLYRMAAFYKNSSGILSTITQNVALDDELSDEVNELSDDHIVKSIRYWERLAEFNPDNIEYLTVLHQLYLLNGMQEEADSIERSTHF